MRITDVHALVGGSVGGEIVWEMARLKPNLFKIIVPIAADWRASDWLIANCKLHAIFNMQYSPTPPPGIEYWHHVGGVAPTATFKLI